MAPAAVPAYTLKASGAASPEGTPTTKIAAARAQGLSRLAALCPSTAASLVGREESVPACRTLNRWFLSIFTPLLTAWGRLCVPGAPQQRSNLLASLPQTSLDEAILFDPRSRSGFHLWHPQQCRPTR